MQKFLLTLTQKFNRLNDFSQFPHFQTLITTDLDNLPINYALLQLVSNPSPTAKHQHDPENSPSLQKLNAKDLARYNLAKECIEQLALYLKPFTNGNMGSVLSRPMQRKLVTLVNCQLVEDEGRSRALRAARSLGERTVTELILQHQNPQQLSANLWAAVRARGCQFLGPAMQEEVLKLVLLALEDGSALSRKVLVMFVVQRLEPHFPQASKTSIGHVVQLLYRASCFKVSKREGDSSLMQLKEEFRTYEALRREHDAQIVQIATEAGLRIAPDQWSALLYGDTGHKSHMQSIIDKLQTPQSFAQSVQELVIALQRTGDPANLDGLRSNLKHLANIDPSTEGCVPTWEEVAISLDAVKEVVVGLVEFVQHHGNRKLQETCHSNHNAKYKISMCRDLVMRSTCPRGTNCTFAHSKEELEKYQAKSRKINSRTPTVPGGKDAVMEYMSEHNLSNASSSFTDESSPRRYSKTQLPPPLIQPQPHNGPMQPSQISNANLHVPPMAHRLQYDIYSGGPINYPPPAAPSSMQNGTINRGMNMRSPRPVPSQNMQALTSQPPPPPPPQFQHNQTPMYSPMQMNNYPPPDVFNTSYPPPGAHPLHYQQQVSPVTVPSDFNNGATYSLNPRQVDMQQQNAVWDQHKQHHHQQQQQQQQQRLMVPMPPQQQNQMKPSISTGNYHTNSINMNNTSASEAIRHSLQLRRQEIMKKLEMRKPTMPSSLNGNVYKPMTSNINNHNNNNNKDDLLSNYWQTVSTTSALPSTPTTINNSFNVDQTTTNRNTYDRSISILAEDDVTIPFDSMQTTSNIYGPISRMPKNHNSSSFSDSLFGESSRSPISPHSGTSSSSTLWPLQQLHQQKPMVSRELSSYHVSGTSVSSPGSNNGVNTSYNNEYSKFATDSLYYTDASADPKINDLSAVERMAKSVGGNSFKFSNDKLMNHENYNELTMELKFIEKTLRENNNEVSVTKCLGPKF